MSRSVVPTMVAVLEAYLAARAAEWRTCPEAGPTLPCKRESGTASIHVRELVRELGVNPEWRQHFRKQQLRDLVNASCREQGLLGIGETAPFPASETAANPAIVRRAPKGELAGAEAALLQQRHRIAELEGQLGLAETDGVLFRVWAPGQGR